jgi:hypothetical protein
MGYVSSRLPEQIAGRDLHGSLRVLQEVHAQQTAAVPVEGA